MRAEMLPKGKKGKLRGLPTGLKRLAGEKAKPKAEEPPTLLEKASNVWWTIAKWAPVPVVLALGFYVSKPTPTVAQLFLWSSSANMRR